MFLLIRDPSQGLDCIAHLCSIIAFSPGFVNQVRPVSGKFNPIFAARGVFSGKTAGRPPRPAAFTVVHRGRPAVSSRRLGQRGGRQNTDAEQGLVGRLVGILVGREDYNFAIFGLSGKAGRSQASL